MSKSAPVAGEAVNVVQARDPAARADLADAALPDVSELLDAAFGPEQPA